MAAESNVPRHRFERVLAAGPSVERRPGGPEVEFAPVVRRRLEERFRQIERAQTDGYSASRDYSVS
jgi:hypothetical protein